MKEWIIQEDDAFAGACGAKEPKGYVHGMGLGPTSQDIDTSRLKCYWPTRLQMEILARKKAQSEKASLEQHLDDLQARIALMEQRGQQDRTSVEPMSRHGSTSVQQHLRNHENDDAELDGDEEDHESDEGSDEDDQLHDAGQSRTAKLKTTPRSKDAPCSEHDALVYLACG